MAATFFGPSAGMLFSVPLGPSARPPRFCTFDKADLADWEVLVESIYAVLSAGSDAAPLRPREVLTLSLLRPAWLLPATIFNVQFMMETEDLRDEGVEV
jgi:hypothetical protein